MARVTPRGLLRSSGVTGAVQIVRVVSSLLLTPIILVAIGLEGFGVWALLFSICNSMHVMGVSFGNAYAKLTAEYDARGDYEGLSERIGSGLALVSVFAALGLLIIVACRDPLLRWIAVPEELLPSAATALLTISITVFGMLSFGCVRQILGGLQRTDLAEGTRMVTSLVYLGVGAWLLTAGYGLVGLAFANLVAEAAGIALGWYWCRKACPLLVISPLLTTRRGVREIFALGGRFQTLYVLNYVSNEGFKVMLSVLLGPRTVGVYELSRRLIRLCETGASAIHRPMMPALANLHSMGEAQRASLMHDRASRAMYSVALLAIGFVAVFADDVLVLWTSSSQPVSALTFRILAAAYIFKQLSSMGTASLRARGEFRLEAMTMVFSLVARFALVFPLYYWQGYEGFVWSESIAHVATALVFLWPYSRREGFSLGRFMNAAALRPTLVLGPIVFAVYVLANSVELPLAARGLRAQAFVELASWGLVYAGASGVAAWYGLVAPAERERLLESLRRGASRDR
ncbi:MAG: polysaccharide biosynthesis C-terminal domain-containing protein [Myxococcota bacterium]|nr:polysaccharide biosynthesis C-terminal domain-containing protein [Myxococcota bacterium]